MCNKVKIKITRDRISRGSFKTYLPASGTFAQLLCSLFTQASKYSLVYFNDIISQCIHAHWPCPGHATFTRATENRSS
jgi:hypothetical protein